MSLERIPVWICDRKHPHFGENGFLTGEIITVIDEPMALVELTDCKHGTDGCYVKKGQVQQNKRHAAPVR